MPIKYVLLAFLLFPLSARADEAADRKELERLRTQVEQMKQLLLLQDAQLRQMEQRAAMTATAPVPAPATPVATPVAAPMPAPAPVEAPTPSSPRAAPPIAAPMPATPPPVVAPAPMPAKKAEGVDPAPYEAATAGRVGMIRISQPPHWLILDEQRLVLWLASDEAYLLELDQACPGLLSMPRLDLETFSTRLRSGQDAVKVAGRRCPVAAIKRLNAGRIPKPPRR